MSDWAEQKPLVRAKFVTSISFAPAEVLAHEAGCRAFKPHQKAQAILSQIDPAKLDTGTRRREAAQPDADGRDLGERRRQIGDLGDAGGDADAGDDDGAGGVRRPSTTTLARLTADVSCARAAWASPFLFLLAPSL